MTAKYILTISDLSGSGLAEAYIVNSISQARKTIKGWRYPKNLVANLIDFKTIKLVAVKIYGEKTLHRVGGR